MTSTGTQAIERKLARDGVRVTAPRRALLAAIEGLGDHFTAEQLAVAAPEVGRATVFRTLRLLQDLGTVCVVVLDDGTTEYRMSAEPAHHHHFVCSECGRVGDVLECDLTELLRAVAASTGFDVEAHRLELYGRCAECRAKGPRSRAS